MVGHSAQLNPLEQRLLFFSVFRSVEVAVTEEEGRSRWGKSNCRNVGSVVRVYWFLCPTTGGMVPRSPSRHGSATIPSAGSTSGLTTERSASDVQSARAINSREASDSSLIPRYLRPVRGMNPFQNLSAASVVHRGVIHAPDTGSPFPGSSFASGSFSGAIAVSGPDSIAALMSASISASILRS